MCFISECGYSSVFYFRMASAGQLLALLCVICCHSAAARPEQSAALPVAPEKQGMGLESEYALDMIRRYGIKAPIVVEENVPLGHIDVARVPDDASHRIVIRGRPLTRWLNYYVTSNVGIVDKKDDGSRSSRSNRKFPTVIDAYNPLMARTPMLPYLSNNYFSTISYTNNPIFCKDNYESTKCKVDFFLQE